MSSNWNCYRRSEMPASLSNNNAARDPRRYKFSYNSETEFSTSNGTDSNDSRTTTDKLVQCGHAARFVTLSQFNVIHRRAFAGCVSKTSQMNARKADAEAAGLKCAPAHALAHPSFALPRLRLAAGATARDHVSGSGRARRPATPWPELSCKPGLHRPPPCLLMISLAPSAGVGGPKKNRRRG